MNELNVLSKRYGKQARVSPGVHHNQTMGALLATGGVYGCNSIGFATSKKFVPFLLTFELTLLEYKSNLYIPELIITYNIS